MACRPEDRTRLPGPQETKPMGHSDDSPTAMKNFLSAKAAGLFRRFSPRLREDYKLADYARCHILPIAPSQSDSIRNAPLTMLGAKKELTLISSGNSPAWTRGPLSGTRNSSMRYAETR